MIQMRNGQVTSNNGEVLQLANSVLYRWWSPACIFAWILFILFEVFIGLNRLFSDKPLCPYSENEYGIIYFSSNCIVFGAFLFTWSILLARIIQSKPGNERVPYFTAFNIVSMGLCANFLSLVFEWGGICIDVLGVASPASIWGEWFACGPLLIFIVVTLVDKPDLTRTDLFLMITFLICLISAFFIIISQTFGIAIFLLIIAFLTYFPLLYLPIYAQEYDASHVDVEERINHFQTFSRRYARRYNLSVWLTISFPLFAVNYILACLKYYGPAETIATYLVLSVLTKGLFVAVAMDVHLDMLVQAQRALVEEQRANTARRAFLKYIFHEVRSPLNSLTMGIEVLERSGNLDDSDRDSLLMMKRASEFMSETLNDVLSIQKIKEGKLELEFSPFSMEDAILKVFATFRGAASAKNISLSKVLASNVPAKVVGDRFRIEHVICSLLSNAIKFSAENAAVQVEVTAGQVSGTDEGPQVVITVTVTDQGPGISEEKQENIFDNFMHIRPGRLQQGQGSGMGLSLCKDIVTLHGGTIGLTSAVGRGSAFHFSIPFLVYGGMRSCQSEDSMSTRITNHMDDSRLTKCLPMSPPVSRANMTVLVVDDVESNRKMLAKLLERSDVVASVACDGQEAVDAVSADVNKFHIVFMDNLMPVMNGVVATKKLREMGFMNLIIGVTGNVLEEDIAEYLHAGADIILGKPIRINMLNMILKYVEENGANSQPGMFLTEHINSLRWMVKPFQS